MLEEYSGDDIIDAINRIEGQLNANFIYLDSDGDGRKTTDMRVIEYALKLLKRELTLNESR